MSEATPVRAEPGTGSDVAAGTVSPGMVTVRYWAAARAAAGLTEERVAAGTLAEVLSAVRGQHPDPAFARVLTAASLLADGVPVGRRRPESVRLDPGVTLEVLPPFAGG